MEMVAATIGGVKEAGGGRGGGRRHGYFCPE